MKKKKNIKKRVKTKQSNIVPVIMDALDRTNQMLKTRFKVKHINYVLDNGVIQKGWLISKEQDIDEAVKLLEVQNAPVYILGQFYSVMFGWDITKSTIIGSLWRYGKKVDEIRSVDFGELKLMMQDWFEKTMQGEKT